MPYLWEGSTRFISKYKQEAVQADLVTRRNIRVYAASFQALRLAVVNFLVAGTGNLIALKLIYKG